MRIILFAIIVLAASSCTPTDATGSSLEPASSSSVDRSKQQNDEQQASHQDEVQGFLGLPDDVSRKIGDEYPESALRDITSISKVHSSTYDDYLRRKNEERIKAKELRNGHIYYAIEVVRHVPFPDGSGAYVTVTERYKAKLPREKQWFCEHNSASNKSINRSRFVFRRFSRRFLRCEN